LWARRFRLPTGSSATSKRLPRTLLLLPQYFQVPGHGFNATEEIRQVELLVGSVQIIVRQAETHHHAGDSEVAVEDAHARERPAPVTPARFVDNALRELT